MYCNRCGKEINEGSEFCGYCGAPQDAAAQTGPAAGQPPPPPEPASYAAAQAPVGAPPPPGGPPAQAGAYSPPPKKSALPWVLGILGVLAAVAVVLVLVFVVFGGDDTKKDSASGGKSTETVEDGSDKKDTDKKDTEDGDSSDTSGPEKVVEDFYRALEKRDADMLLDTFEPSFREELEEALGENKDLFFEEFFSYFPADMKVEITKMETEVDGDSASVTIVEGTMSYTDEYGEEVVEDAAESEVEASELVKVGGKWYLSGDFLVDSGFDPEEIKDIDWEALDQL